MERKNALFPSIDGLRPTLGSQREAIQLVTAHYKNSRCLDLFAGQDPSASRPPRLALLPSFGRKIKKAYLSLLSNAELLNAENCRIFHATAQSFLENIPSSSISFF